MRIGLFSLGLTAAAAASIAMVGCGSNNSQTPGDNVGRISPTLTSNAVHDDQTDHDLCDHAGHQHPTEGPHGGHLIELGDEQYHAELLHDEKTHTVTVHLLDAAGKEPVAVAAPEITLQLFRDGQFLKYALKGPAESSDSAGSASQFQVVDAGLCDALCEQDALRGRLQVTIDGRQYTGTIEHHGHDHDGHDCDGDDHDGHDCDRHDHDGDDHDDHDH